MATSKEFQLTIKPPLRLVLQLNQNFAFCILARLVGGRVVCRSLIKAVVVPLAQYLPHHNPANLVDPDYGR